MNLTWHIVRNDLRRLRLPLALWTVLLVAKLGLGAVLMWSGAGAGAWFDRVGGTVYLLGAIEVLLGYVLVAWLIHGDMPTGTTAFWMTRPLSGLRLLAAKLAGLGLIFGVVPLIVTLPWWLACDYGPRELALAAGETLALHGIVVAFALPLAALTDEFGRYLMWTLVLVAAYIGISLTMVIVPGLGPFGSANAGLIATRGWLALALFLICGGVAAVLQFCARRLLFSFATVGAGVVVALVTLTYWPRDLSRKTSTPDRPGSHAADISFALQSVGTTKPRQGEDAELYISLKLQGAPPGLLLAGGDSEQQWRWAGGPAIDRGGWIPGVWGKELALRSLGIAPEKPNLEYKAYLAERRLRNGLPAMPESRFNDPTVRTVRVKVPQSIAARMRQEPPFYRLRAQLSLHRPEVVAEQPPRVGDRLARDSDHARLAQVERRGGGLVVATIEHRPLLLWDGLDQLEPMGAFYRRGWQMGPHYFLVNRGRGNATESYGGQGWRAARVGTVGILWRPMSFNSPRDYLGDGKWVEQPGWLDGATLAKVVFREEERFTTELRVERFDLAKLANKEGAR